MLQTLNGLEGLEEGGFEGGDGVGGGEGVGGGGGGREEGGGEG